MPFLSAKVAIEFPRLARFSLFCSHQLRSGSLLYQFFQLSAASLEWSGICWFPFFLRHSSVILRWVPAFALLIGIPYVGLKPLCWSSNPCRSTYLRSYIAFLDRNKGNNPSHIVPFDSPSFDICLDIWVNPPVSISCPSGTVHLIGIGLPPAFILLKAKFVRLVSLVGVEISRSYLILVF